MKKKVNPETYELYHQKIIEQYSKEDEAAQKATKSVESTTKAVEKSAGAATKAAAATEKSTKTTVKATKAANDSAKDVEKAAEKTESTVIRKVDKVYKYFIGLSQMTKEARDKEFRDLSFNHQMGYISEEQYYKDLAELRDKHFTEDSEEWQKYTLQIHKYQTGLIEKQKEDIINLYDEISREATSAISNLEKKYDKVKNNLSSLSPIATKYTSVFKDQGAGMVFENGVWKNHKDYIVEEYRLADYDAEISKLGQIYELLSAVKEKGISKEFFDIFTDLSPDDILGTANAILSLPDEEFDKFYNSWQKYQQATDATAYMMTEDDREAIISEYGNLGEDLKNTLTETFGTIPESFYEYGMLSADEFGKGFASRINTTMSFIAETNSVKEAFSQDGGTSNTYNFYGSDKTDTERLMEVKRFNEITKMRGE